MRGLARRRKPRPAIITLRLRPNRASMSTPPPLTAHSSRRLTAAVLRWRLPRGPATSIMPFPRVPGARRIMPARIAGLLTVRPRTPGAATSPSQETPTRAGMPRGRMAVSPTIARTAAIPTLTIRIAGIMRTAQRRHPETPRRLHRTGRAAVGNHVPVILRIKMRLASKTTSHRGVAAILVAEATGRKGSHDSRRVCVAAPS
jgi:hypothetical protein